MIGANLSEIIRKFKKQTQEETNFQIKQILDSNPSAIEQKNKLKQTPIFYAVKKNAFDILELLVIEYNADITVKDKHGNEIQVFATNIEMLDFIRELKEEVQRRKQCEERHLCDLIRKLHKNPENELHYRLRIQKRISSHPHEINEGTYQGRTACHWAVILNLPAILELLVHEGNADLHKIDKLGKNLLDHAKTTEVKNIVSNLTKDQVSKTLNHFFLEEAETEQEEKEASPRVRKLKRITQDLESLTLGKFRRKRRSLSEPLQKSKYSVSKTKKRSETENKKMPLMRSVTDPSASLRSSSTISTFEVADIIGMAIDKEDDSVVSNWLDQKENPNNRCHNDGRPYILHAFLQRATKCFLLLLLNGADIKICNNLDQNIMSFLEEGKQKGREQINRENLDFLLFVLNRINTYIDLDEINAAKERLTVLEEQFNRGLILSGLNRNFNPSNCRLLSRRELSDIIELQSYPKQLVKRIYESCSSVKFSKKNIAVNFNMLEFRNTVIGLLSHDELHHKINIPIMILGIVSHFYHHYFASNQKLMAMMLIKEIIKWNDFANPRKKALFKAKLNEFMNLTSKDGFEELNSLLMEMLEQCEVVANPYVDAHHKVNAILNRAGYCGNTSLREKIDELVSYCSDTKDLTPVKSLASLLSNELRAISLQFYQLLHRSEFSNKGWTKDTSEETSPNIVHQQLMFNNLVYLLKYEILKRDSENERAVVISLYIMTIEALLEHDIPDYNMAMAVSAALHDSDVSRLKKSFSAVPVRLLESWEHIQTILSESHNYKNQRDILKRNTRALTFLGIYTRDVTFIYDGNNEKSTKKERYPLMGGIYGDIFQRHNLARTIFIQFKTDLPSLLKHKVNVSNSSFYEMSILLEPPILYLTSGFDRGYLELILKSYIQNKQVLQVQIAGELKEGIAAVDAIYGYVENLVKQRSLKVNEGNHIIAQACKAAGGEKMGFNSLQYNRRLNDIGNILGDDVRELFTLIGSDRVKIKLKDDDKRSKKEKEDQKESSDKKTVTVAIEVTIKQNEKKGRSYILRQIRDEEEKEKRKEKSQGDEKDLPLMLEFGAPENELCYGYREAILNRKSLYDGRSGSGYALVLAEEKGKEKEHSKSFGSEITVIEHDLYSEDDFTEAGSEQEGMLKQYHSDLEGSDIGDDGAVCEPKDTTASSHRLRYL